MPIHNSPVHPNHHQHMYHIQHHLTHLQPNMLTYLTCPRIHSHHHLHKVHSQSHHTSPKHLRPLKCLPPPPSHHKSTYSPQWTQMDEHLRAQVVPLVLQADNIEDMNALLCRGIQDFLVANYPPQKQRTCKRSGGKRECHQRALKAVREEKKAAKRQLRALRRRNDSPEEVRALAIKFHQLVRQHCKLVKVEKRKERTRTMHQQRRDCHRNFWRFANTLFNDDSCSHVEPDFDEKTAESFFKKTYEPKAATFERPPWMKPSQPPSTPLPTDNISSDELEEVLKKCRSSSTPSPADQISYSVLKHCPSLIPALLRLYNLCWATKQVPGQWKVGAIQPLGKSVADKNPSCPSNFRLIALTSCVGKVYTSILKRRWQHFMVSNGYLNTSIQKAFVNGIPGSSEHHLKL